MKNKVYNLFEICNPKQWKTISIDNLDKNAKYPVYGANGVIGYYFEYNHEKPTLCITCRGATSGELNISTSYSYINGNTMALDDLDETKVDINFLYYYLKKRGFKDIISGSAQPQITRISLKKISIPLYTLSFQKKVASNLKKIEDIIKFKKNQLLNLTELVKSLFTKIFGDPLLNDKKEWNFFKIKDIGKIISGSTPSTNIPEYWNGEYLWITPAELNDDSFIINSTDRKLTYLGVKASSLIELPIGTVLLSSRAPIGKVAIVGEKMFCNQGFKNIIPNETINSIYLYYVFKEKKEYLNFLGRGATFKELSKEIVENISIKVPPIELQNKFAERIEKIEKLKFTIMTIILNTYKTMKKKGVEKD